MPEDEPTLPTEVTPEVGLFDRFASACTRFVSRAPFFAICVAMVFLWLPSYFLFGDPDTWQLVINTATTIVTFLLVALLQNGERRSDQATQHKLNAIANGLSDLLAAAGHDADAEELNAAVGLEDRETSR
jgi:low affinity Fe/Cu permease